MKRLTSLLSLVCAFTLTAQAQQLSVEQARQNAMAVLSKKSNATLTRAGSDLSLVHTQKSLGEDKALYYVFGTHQNDGFVIASADERANAVLGYAETGTYEQSLTIPAFREWIDGCKEAMQWLCSTEVAAVASSYIPADIPDQVVTDADGTLSLTIPGRHYSEAAALPASVEPLLEGINWDQDEPYNRMTPLIPNKNTHCATGCVATAMAQIMKYYEWPKQGTGSVRYTPEGIIKEELEADFSQSVYDWDNMLGDYSGDYTDEQADAVAKLMSDVGIAMRMDYGPESAASHPMMMYAMAVNFGYNRGMEMCRREHYDYTQWNNLLKQELAASRPVCMGAGYPEGHQFVLDGYDEDDLYHVNWGWGGKSNGYFDINFLRPSLQGTGGSEGGFPAGQKININCFPDIEGTSLPHPKMAVDAEPILIEDTICCTFDNYGLGIYVGQVGYVAMVDDEIVGFAFEDVEKFNFMGTYRLKSAIADLDIDAEKVAGGKKCLVYPAYYVVGEGYRVPLSKVAFQRYLILSLDDDGNVVSETNPMDNANVKCDSLEITRSYAGFSVRAIATLTNAMDCPTFDRSVYMIIWDENNKRVSVGIDFAFIEPGETREFVFTCTPDEGKIFESGKTYGVELLYGAQDEDHIIPNSRKTITMKDPGGAPSLSYADYAIDKTVIAPNEYLTVTFNVENAGGFFVEKYYVYVFKEGDDKHSLKRFPLPESDLHAGTTTVSTSAQINLPEGNYYCNICYKKDGNWVDLNNDLTFTIKDPASAISNVTEDADTSGQYYDLQGRRVDNPAKGIYILNGKKIVK